MKLVTKVSLVAGIVFFLATQALSLFMLLNMWNDNLQIVMEAEQQKFETATDNFTGRARNSQISNYGDLTRRTVLQQVFRSSTTAHMALYQEEDEIYNQSGYDFQRSERKPLDETRVERQKVGERSVLVLGRSLQIANEEYQVYCYKDITYLLDQVKRSAVTFFGASLAAAVILALVLILMERQILKPIYRLRAGAEEIGRGNYQKRISIHRMDEVGQISKSFNEMADQVQRHMQVLEKSNEMQKQMLGSLGHELRTPMTSIIGFADTLLRVKLADEQKERALFFIQHECKRLSRLSQKLLELNSLSEGSAIERDTPLSEEFFRRVGQVTAPGLEKENKRLEIRVLQVPRPILVDCDLMESLLLNLIDNGRKASEPGQTIRLQIDKNQFSVEDEGRGIPPEEIEKVTKAFYMVDKARSKQQGSVGLGLALCSQIALLHHGELKIESVPGEGTQVTVVFGEK